MLLSLRNKLPFVNVCNQLVQERVLQSCKVCRSFTTNNMPFEFIVVIDFNDVGIKSLNMSWELLVSVFVTNMPAQS